MSDADIKRVTFDTANELFFGGRIPEEQVNVEYDPTLWEKYGYNPFAKL